MEPPGRAGRGRGGICGYIILKPAGRHDGLLLPPLLAASLLAIIGGGVLALKALDRAVPVEAQAGNLALAGRVTDAAGLLSVDQIYALDHFLAEFEQRTQHQMVVVTVPTLGNQDISSYTRNLGNRWGIGRKGVHDGVVLLLAPNERRVQIMVGYGLEAVLTNRVCADVLATQMVPRFREARYYEGLMDGIRVLARLTSAP